MSRNQVLNVGEKLIILTCKVTGFASRFGPSFEGRVVLARIPVAVHTGLCLQTRSSKEETI